MPHSIFLHIPKCGGNWVYKVLREQGLYGDQIRSWDRFDSFERNHGSMHCVPPGRKSDVPCFTFVRHPLEWFRSYHNYKARRGMFDLKCMLSKVRGDPRFVNQFDLATGMNGGKDDFRTWVENVWKSGWRGYYARYVEFFTSMCEPENIGRVENLEDDLADILSRLEPGADLSVIDRYRRKKINAFENGNEYAEAAERMVLEMGAPVIRKFYAG